MLKLAYFSGVGALITAPVHFIANDPYTRALLVALVLAAVLFACIGLSRRP